MAQGVYQGENKIADLNVIEGVKVNGTELTPDGSKKVDVLIPDISTDIAEDATSDTKTASPKAVKTYVDNHVPSVPVEDVTVGGTSVVTNKVAVIDLSGKQDTLVGSGTGQNIKTVNDQSLLGTGNIDAKDIFWATYDSTTSAQIEAAYQAGKMVCVFWSNRVYTLIYRSSATGHTFGYVWGGTTYRVVCTSNAWTNTSVSLQNTEDKVSTLTGYESNTSKYPNTKAVYDAIAALPSPMVFKGTIGTGGTSTTVPSSPTEGDTYKIISGGESLTFSGISGTIKVGDTVIYKNSTTGWVLIPSGDEPSGTVTNVTAGAGLNTTGDDASSDGGSITSSGSINLTKSGVTAGTYQGLTVDKYGRVTAAGDEGYYKKPSGGIPASDLANGVIVEEVFWATYGTTTSTDIQAALDANKLVLTINSENKLAIYHKQDTNYMYFGSIYGASSAFVILTKATNVWTCGSWMLERGENKKTTITGNESSDTYYPTTKAVADALPVANPTVPSGTTPTALTGLKVGSDYYSVSGGGGGGTTVEANPTVPSGTTPTDVKGLKIGNGYYDICAVHLDITNNDIDSAINTAWV